MRKHGALESPISSRCSGDITHRSCATTGVIRELTDAGFDIEHAFDARAAARELELPALEDPERPVGVLVGNTRALWPTFLAARAADPTLRAASDPLDRYTEATIERACATVGGVPLYAHRRYGATFLPFQRLAAAVGLAALAPTQLLVHPTFGPWLALRAVILRPGSPPPHRAAVRACTCDAACTEAFDRARQSQDSWQAWLAARDACTVGRQYRYSDAQLAYHYTKDPRFLDGG